VCLSHPDKIELKKSSLPSENKKYATAQTDTTKTVKRSIDNGLQGRTTEHQPVTAVWRNGGYLNNLSKEYAGVSPKMLSSLNRLQIDLKNY
jgi:hypothetical protein